MAPDIRGVHELQYRLAVVLFQKYVASIKQTSNSASGLFLGNRGIRYEVNSLLAQATTESAGSAWWRNEAVTLSQKMDEMESSALESSENELANAQQQEGLSEFSWWTVLEASMMEANSLRRLAMLPECLLEYKNSQMWHNLKPPPKERVVYSKLEHRYYMKPDFVDQVGMKLFPHDWTRQSSAIAQQLATVNAQIGHKKQALIHYQEALAAEPDNCHLATEAFALACTMDHQVQLGRGYGICVEYGRCLFVSSTWSGR